MQLVHTRRRTCELPTCARTLFRFTSQRRLVTLCAWLILLPALGPFLQISQTLAMMSLQKLDLHRRISLYLPVPKQISCQEGYAGGLQLTVCNSLIIVDLRRFGQTG